MNIDEIVKRISKTDGLSKTLGMKFISTPEPDTIMATMKVDERNRQPFGFLSGGASLALAENVAGIGSLALCPGRIAVGINVSGTHVIAVSEGDTVTAYAKLVHKGRVLHTWQVDIRNSQGETVCTVQVTNYVITPKKDQPKKQAESEDDGFCVLSFALRAACHLCGAARGRARNPLLCGSAQWQGRLRDSALPAFG